MSGAWLLLWLARLPCLPGELEGVERPPSQPPPPPDVEPPPAPLPRAMPQPAALPPPLALAEVARYRIDFGLLGSVGEIRFSIEDRVHADGDLVRLRGEGDGAILGFGRMEKAVASEFDAQRLGSRRWTASRRSKGRVITDTAEQPRPGTVELARRRDGGPAERQQASFGSPALDPLGFILRLRVAPPAAGRTETFHVLDGRALWRITLSASGVQPLPDGLPLARALRIEGRADPIFYDGRIDDAQRQPRTFVLWLSEDTARIPLRLSIPVGLGEVDVQLVDLERRPR